MSTVLRIATVVLFVSAFAACASEAPAGDDSGMDVGQQTAPWGVYRGGGCHGVDQLEQFVAWFGRRPARGLDFFSTESWDELVSSASWSIACWDDAGHPDMTFSLPMLPDDAADDLARGAKGAFDEVFRGVARELVDYGYGDAVIRPGWEFNGDWSSWAAAGREQDWIAYWRRIVDVMRDVPGSDFAFDWTVANADTEQRAADAYPGDGYVDIIGLDVYNQLWSPTETSAEERWDELLRGPHGLEWHKRFAAAHAKPLSFPEWGTGTRPEDHGGGGDDPYFIRKMAAWIARNEVAYHNYWDYQAPDYDAELSAGRQPNAAEAFLSTFRTASAR